MKTPSIAALTLTCALAFGSVATASVTIDSTDIQIGGFLSQGYLYSTNNNFPTVDKGGTWDFREMAFNVSDTIGAHLRVGAQGFAEAYGPYGGDTVLLDWAIADYNVNPAFGIRLGRVKMPKSLYSDAQDLDSVRPFVFLPNALYSPVLRDFSASFDGGMIYGSLAAGSGSVDYKLYYGHITMGPQQGVADFFNNTGIFSAPGLKSVGVNYTGGVALTWNTPITGLRCSAFYNRLSHLDAQGDFALVPAAYGAVPLDLHGTNLDSFTFAAEEAFGQWTLASEFQTAHDTDYLATPLFAPIKSLDANNAWYVSCARRLGSKTEVGVNYSELRNLHPAAGANPASNYQKTWAVCLRYDMNDHVVLKIECDRVAGTQQTLNTARVSNPPGIIKDSTLVVAAKSTISF